MRKNFDKSYSPRAWKAMKIVAQPNLDHGQVRQDGNGRYWEYAFHIQNIYVRQVSKPALSTLKVNAGIEPDYNIN